MRHYISSLLIMLALSIVYVQPVTAQQTERENADSEKSENNTDKRIYEYAEPNKFDDRQTKQLNDRIKHKGTRQFKDFEERLI